MNAVFHAKSAAKRWGGIWQDYMPVELFIDESKSILADFRHRALRHHAEGIWLCERVLGPTIVNSNGVHVPVRMIAERHVQEDLGKIPSFADWARRIPGEAWMVGEGQPKTREL